MRAAHAVQEHRDAGQAKQRKHVRLGNGICLREHPGVDALEPTCRVVRTVFAGEIDVGEVAVPRIVNRAPTRVTAAGDLGVALLEASGIDRGGDRIA